MLLLAATRGKSTRCEEIELDAPAAAFLERVLSLAEVMTVQNPAWANALLSDAAHCLPCGEWVKRIIHNCASTRSRAPSQDVNQREHVEPILEALIHANTAAATAIINTGNKLDGNQAAAIIAEGFAPNAGASERSYYEVRRLLPGLASFATATAPGGVADLLRAIDNHAEPRTAVRARGRILSLYLRECHAKDRAWDENVLVLLIGEEGDALRKRVAIAVETEGSAGLSAKPANRQFGDDLWFDVARFALRSHCPPALACCGPVLKARPRDPMRCLGLKDVLTPGTTKGEGGFSAVRMRETLLSLRTLGYDITMDDGEPAALILAREPDSPNRIARLLVLLDLGLDADAANVDGERAVDRLPAPAARIWSDLVMAHHLQVKAHTLIGALAEQRHTSPAP